jgi:hypothetical protein
MQVLSQQLPGLTEANHQNLCHNNRCPDQDSNRTLLDYEFTHLDHLAMLIPTGTPTVRIGSGAHPASYAMGTDAPFPGVKAAGK